MTGMGSRGRLGPDCPGGGAQGGVAPDQDSPEGETVMVFQVSRIAERPHLVVVENGMAAVHTIKDMLSLAPDRYSITVFGAERHGHHNRIPLSAVLAGARRWRRSSPNRHRGTPGMASSCTWAIR